MKLTFKNVLITGGAGFIGSNIASKLVDKGVNVTVLDSLSEQIHGQKPEETSPLYLSIKDKVKFIKGSVTSREDWQKPLMVKKPLFTWQQRPVQGSLCMK